MRRLQEIDRDITTTGSIVQLTGAFEGIASAQIARIKDQVQQSELFFKELWPTYTALRVSKGFRKRKAQRQRETKKDLLIVITSEGSLSGDIDQRLIEQFLAVYHKNKHDLVVIGRHGEVLLKQHHVQPQHVYSLPDQAHEATVVQSVVEHVQQYEAATVYFQSYTSLMSQTIKNIALNAVVQERGDSLERSGEIDALITDVNYIFEPTIIAVIEYMERSMLGIALSEVLLESKLAQQASRFRAMSAARIKAKDTVSDLMLQYRRGSRAIKDERTKEIISALRRKSSAI